MNIIFKNHIVIYISYSRNKFIWIHLNEFCL